MERIKKSNNTTLSIRTSRENIAELKREAEEKGFLLSNYCWDLIMKGRNSSSNNESNISEGTVSIEIDEIYALSKDCETKLSEMAGVGSRNITLLMINDLKQRIKDIAIRSKRMMVNKK